MIVLAMIGGMMALGVSIFIPGNDQKVQDAAVRLAGTIKYLFDEAAVKNRYYRVVFNLDERSYSIESNSEPFLVTLEEEEGQAGKPQATPGAENQPEGSPGAVPQFAVVDEDALTKPVTLPSGVKFKDILVMHSLSPQETGKAYLYFFPNGWVEPVIVNLSDDDDEAFYSLEINPLTGRAKILGEYRELKEGGLRPEATP
jgi:general secretion pathway protein H